MNRETLLAYYERLTALVEKLPGGLQKPILNELVPIRQLFLEQRPPRLLLIGDPRPSTHDFLLSVISHHPGGQISVPDNAGGVSGGHDKAAVSPQPPPLPCLKTGDTDNGWRTLAMQDRAAVQILDAREEGISREFLDHALERHLPDAVILFQGEGGMDAAQRFQQSIEILAGSVFSASLLLPDAGEGKKEAKASATRAPMPSLIAISTAAEQLSGVERLRALVHSRRELANWNLRVLHIADAAAIGPAICAFLPNQARLEFALFGDIRPAQVEIARSLLKSFTAVCGVIGMQPIPLADLPVLTTLQSLMVGLIAYVSGRRLGPRAVAEFSGAVGISFGLGVLLREGARAAIKVVPGFGNAISGMVAGAGTYAIGRAAIAYFVERVPAPETKKLFQTIRPRKTTFMRRLSWKRKVAGASKDQSKA